MKTESPNMPDRANLLSVRGLSKSYRRHGASIRRSLVEAVRSVDLDIAEGSTMGLVGESGAGKSTLARCIALLEQPDSGVIRLSGREISQLSGRDLRPLRREVQMIFQDPSSALNFRFTAAEIVEEPLLVQKIADGTGRLRRVREAFSMVGLPASISDRFPQQLSGGQRQRLALARALILKPKLLVLDEALAGLDLSIQAQLVNLLVDLREDHSLTYLFISHDLGLVAYIASEISVMSHGEIVEKAPTSELFSNPRSVSTRALIESIPSIHGTIH